MPPAIPTSASANIAVNRSPFDRSDLLMCCSRNLTARVILLALVAVGCGTSEPVTDATEQLPATTLDDSAPDTATTHDSGTAFDSVKIRKDADGRQYLGNVPLNVFFDDPLKVASDNTPVHVEMTSSPAAHTSIEPGQENGVDFADSESPAANKFPVSSTDWSTVIPAEFLDSEIKAARNFLNQKLRTAGAYNASVTMIPPRAATVAILAAIAAEHPGRISWKNDAVYIRDLAAKMLESPLQRGPKDQRRLLALFEDMSDTLNRSRPAGLDEPADVTYAEVADMRLVMMRLKSAESVLQTEIGESRFQSDSERVRHEAAMLGGLMKAMSTESYGYSENLDFLKYANGIIDGASALRQAVEADDFTAFELNLSRISTSCQACHREFKND